MIAAVSTVSSLVALNHTPRPQLALQSSGRDKKMVLTSRRELTVLLAVPEYIQNRKIASPTTLTLTWFWKERKKATHRYPGFIAASDRESAQCSPRHEA